MSSSDYISYFRFILLRSFSSQFSDCTFFFFHDTATTEIYTLSLHDALPISTMVTSLTADCPGTYWPLLPSQIGSTDRKSTRLNSSHLGISYAVFCLKKKKEHQNKKACEHTDLHSHDTHHSRTHGDYVRCPRC